MKPGRPRIFSSDVVSAEIEMGSKLSQEADRRPKPGVLEVAKMLPKLCQE